MLSSFSSTFVFVSYHDDNNDARISPSFNDVMGSTRRQHEIISIIMAAVRLLVQLFIMEGLGHVKKCMKGNSPRFVRKQIARDPCL